MASEVRSNQIGQPEKSNTGIRRKFTVPIATRLVASFLVIIVTGNLVFTIAGISLIGNRIVSEAQERVRTDLNSAREIYLGELRHISDVVRMTAYRPIISEALLSGYDDIILADLMTVMNNEGLDILTLTDANGTVILRAGNPEVLGDDQSENTVVNEVLRGSFAVATTAVFSSAELSRES